MNSGAGIETIVPTLLVYWDCEAKHVIKHLSPSIVRKIWGGSKLESMKSLESSNDREPVGETLEIFDSHLPYLAKFIDTSDELSIQVHPDDEYARLHENSLGKTECWIILEAAPGAGIYLGLKPNVTKEILKSAIAEKKAINGLLNFYPVNKGDFFYVTAGSIHAIGKNITLAEVQQNSGITYRVWDWNRVDDLGVGRELHVEKSLDVINFDPAANSSDYFKIKRHLFDKPGLNEICFHPQFHLFLLNMKKGNEFLKDLKELTRPCSILNLNGKISVNESDVKSYGAVTVLKEKNLKVTALEDGALLLIF